MGRVGKGRARHGPVWAFVRRGPGLERTGHGLRMGWPRNGLGRGTALSGH
jgi:hypothetical protein